MRTHFRTLALSLAPALLSLPVQAGSPPPPCFNFESKITAPLVAAVTTFKEGEDPGESGKAARDASGTRYDFGKVSGVVKAPIQKIYEQLLDPSTIRNDDNTQIVVKEIASPNFLKRIEQSIRIKPVFFLTLDWKETWTYSLLKGTAETPESILVSYEKTEGTSHLRHLCGSILVQKLGPEQSGVFLYEEVDADRREAKDVLNGIRGTLATLRGEKSHKK